MPVLNPSEYDNAYFDPYTTDTSGSTANSVLAGYPRYERWVRGYGDKPEDAGEEWAEIARRLASNGRFQNQTVLEVGCAKGFIVKDLRDVGIEAYGLDVSAYAVGEADSAVRPFLTVGDARVVVPAYTRNQFNWLFSLRFFECIPDADIQPLINAMKLCSRNQIHQIGTNENPNHYNIKTEAQWRAFDWGNRATLFFNERPNLP